MSKILKFLQPLLPATHWLPLLNIGLSAVIGYYAVQFGLQFTHAPAFPKIQAQPDSVSDNAPIVPTRPVLDMTPVLNAYLFGEAKTVTSAPAVMTPPVTPLDLKLHGVFYSSDPQIARAVIITADGKTGCYRVGQTVGSATIQEIRPKELTLLRNQRLETLTLVEIKSAGKSTTDNREMPASVLTTNASAAPATSDLKPEKLLGTYQQELAANPSNLSQLSQLLRLAPVNEGDKFIGYRLNPGKDASLMAKFNLQAGDILTTVNGITLDSPMKSLTTFPQLVNTLSTADQLNIQVLRNGQPISLSFAIEK